MILNCAISHFIIWLAPRAGKMTQIARCDWLPERGLGSSGLPAVSRKQNYPERHIIDPLLTKFARSRWLDIGLLLFLQVYGPRLLLILTSHLVNNPYLPNSSLNNKTTEQSPSLKMKLTSRLTEIDYVVIGFFCGFLSAKQNCFGLGKHPS